MTAPTLLIALLRVSAATASSSGFPDLAGTALWHERAVALRRGLSGERLHQPRQGARVTDAGAGDLRAPDEPRKAMREPKQRGGAPMSDRSACRCHRRALRLFHVPRETIQYVGVHNTQPGWGQRGLRARPPMLAARRHAAGRRMSCRRSRQSPQRRIEMSECECVVDNSITSASQTSGCDDIKTLGRHGGS